VLALAVWGLSAAARAKEPLVYASNPDDITPRLVSLETTMAAHGYDVKRWFRPGLRRAEIDRMAKGLAFPLPEEIYRLYEWHDGVLGDGAPLIFRDHYLMPLAEALRHLDVARSYDLPPAIPFAEFEGSYLLLPVAKYGLHPALERPVIHLHQGRDVYFYNVPRMLDTMIDWIREGVRPGHVGGEEKELAIWRKHNPTIFDRSSAYQIQ